MHTSPLSSELQPSFGGGACAILSVFSCLMFAQLLLLKDTTGGLLLYRVKLSLEMPAADKNKVASTRRRSKGKATKLRLPFVGLLFKASYYELLCRVGIEAHITDVKSLC